MTRVETPFDCSRLALLALVLALLSLAPSCAMEDAAPAAEARFFVFWPEGDVGWELFEETADGITALEADTRLPPGRHRLHARPLGITLERSETLEVELQPGRIHVWAPGGVAARATVHLEGRWRRIPATVYSGGALTVDVDGADRAVPTAAPFRLKATDGIHASAALGVVITNPYDDPFGLDVRVADRRQQFVLAPVTSRFVPASKGEKVSFEAYLGTEPAPADAHAFPAPPGTVIAPIGGATLFRWVEEDVAEEKLVSPARLIPLSLAAGQTLHPLATHDVYPLGRPLLAVVKPRVGRSVLTAVSSAPLLETTPGPLGELTTHPDLQVRVLPTPGADPEGPVTDLAVAGPGAVVVVDGVAHDLTTGAPLHEAGQEICGATWGAERLALRTREGRICFPVDGRLVPSRDLADPALRLAGGTGPFILYGSRLEPVLAHWMPGFHPRPLVAAGGHPATAVTEGEDGVYFARGATVERLPRLENDDLGDPETVLELPGGQRVVGLCRVDAGLLVATVDAVLLFDGQVVIPLLVGAGGPLQSGGTDVFVHDRRSRRVIRIRGELVKGAL